jgi:hypothetical protein
MVLYHLWRTDCSFGVAMLSSDDSKMEILSNEGTAKAKPIGSLGKKRNSLKERSSFSE